MTGKGNYSGTASATFTLNPINIEGGGISMSGDSATYDGTDKRPTVSGVMLSSGEGLLTDDYDLSYEPSGDWINAGNYTITAKGKNNAYGTVNKTFTIARHSLNAVDVECIFDSLVTYETPEAAVAALVLKLGERTLQKDVDYTVETDVDGNEVKLTITGINNFVGQGIVMGPLSHIYLDSAEVILSPQSAVYTGSAVNKPGEAVEVDLIGSGVQTLVNGTDYEVSYSDGWIDAGEYTVTVTGKGNCTGTASATFTIEPASVAGGEIGGVTVPANATAIQNDGVTVSVGGRTLVAGDDYDLTVTESNGVVTVSVIGKGNYKDTLSANYTSVTTQIIDLSSANVSVVLGGSMTAGNNSSGYTYEFTGEQIRPTVEIATESRTLEQGTDYNVTFGENTNVGTGSVAIRPGRNSLVNGSRSIQFTIVPRSIVNANVTGVTEPATREQVEQNVAVVVNGRTLGPNDFTTDVRQQGRLVNVTITGQGNYKDSLSLQFNRSIEAGDTDLSVVIGDAPTGSGAVYAYTGDQIRPSLNVSVDGQSLTQGTDYSVSYRNNTDAGQGTVIVGPGRNGIINFTRAYNFTITPRYLDNVSFEGVNGATNATTIQNNTAAIRVMVDGRELKVGEDFHLDAQDLPEAGVCIVVVTGQGNYEGEWSVNFTLTSFGGTGGGNATAETDEPEPPNLLQVTLEKLSEIAMRIIALLESRNDGQGVEWDILFYQSGVDPANASSSPYSEDNPTGYVFINTLIPGMQDGSGRVIFTNQSTSNITLKSGQYLYDQVINLTDSQFHGSLKTNTTYGVTFTEGVRVVSGNFTGSVITSQPSAVVNVRIPDPSEGAVTFLSNSAANSTGTNGTNDNGGAANKGGQAVTYPADLNCRLAGHVRTGELVLKGRFTRAAEDGNVTVTCYEATFACSRCGTDLGGTCFAVIGAADDVEPGRDANVTDTRNGLSLDGVFAKDGDLFFDGKVLRSLADANGGAYDYRKVQTADGFAIEFSKAFLNKQADGEHQVLIINGDEFWPLMVSFQGHRLDGLRLAIQDEAPAMTEAEYEAWRQTAAAKGDGVQELTVGKGK